jgi:hypothetical protein
VHGEEAAPAAPLVSTWEFKAEIVELCQRGDRSVGQVARASRLPKLGAD